MNHSIKVLVVDDSAFMRYTIAKHLEADPEIHVVGSARDGLDALDKIPTLHPDVITLDVEMPRLDGLNTLQRIMAECPTPVIMLSSLTQQGARTTIQALVGGAVDFIPKPTAATDIRNIVDSLIVKVKTAARANFRAKQSSSGKFLPAKLHEFPVLSPKIKLGLRPFRQGDPIIVIGSSTGGPRALQQVLSNLPGDLPAAVIVVQHMPAGFTRSLAQRLNDTCALIVQEANHGDRLARGLVLLAPGDYHLQLRDGKLVHLDHGPRRNHVRPSVDVTMESVVQYHKSAVIGVVLTGMGSDGSAGAGSIKAAGGKIIAEHESTSVVYGMPRSVVEADLADWVIPLPEVASALVELVNNGNVGI